jgi:hypothetical protein
MQGQELSPRLRKSDFSTIGLVPDVPDKPIRGVRDRKLLWGVDRKLAVGGGLVIQ